MFNEKIFDLKLRKQIYEFIRENPGLHFRKIARTLKIPNSTLRYHLCYLEKRGIISSEVENGYSRYYVLQKVSKNDKKLLGILREPVPRNIILYLTLYTNSSQTDIKKFAKKWKNHPSKIAFHLDKHHTTLSFHLKKLINEDILESYTQGSTVRYHLKKPEEIVDLLIRYDKTILSEAYGRFLKWVEIPDDSLDAVIKIMFDIFPIPFRC